MRIRPRIAVILEGGLVQGIVTDDEQFIGVDVMVIDYDAGQCDGGDDFRTKIPQGDDTDADAWTRVETIGRTLVPLGEVWERMTDETTAAA